MVKRIIFNTLIELSALTNLGVCLVEVERGLIRIAKSSREIFLMRRAYTWLWAVGQREGANFLAGRYACAAWSGNTVGRVSCLSGETCCFQTLTKKVRRKGTGRGGERKSLGVGSPEIWGGVVGTWSWSLDALWSPACCSRVGSTACLKSVEWRQQLGPVKLVLSGFLSGFTDLPEKRP